MATKKRNKGNPSCGMLVGIIVLCLLVVLVVGCVKNAQTDDETPNNDLQATSGTSVENTDTSDDVKTDSEKKQTQESTDTVSSDPVSSATGSSTSATSSSTSSKKDDPIQSSTSDYVSANDTASFDKDEWYMILANPTHALPEGYTFEQANVYSAGRNWVMDARCAEDMKAMLAAAKKDGVDLMICSAYRTIERQTANFNSKMQEYINKGYSEEEARKVTATIIAVPGTSEHHTGLAADIVTPSYQRLNAGFDQTAAYKWLEANCARFGFTLRYRKDKTDITGIIYEPWHYRYVGKEAAEIMMAEKISFEEFLEKYGT